MSVCDIDFGLEMRKAHEEGYAEGLRDAAKWISVKEKLPEYGERVLFLTKERRLICVGPYRGEGGRGAQYFFNGNRIETAMWWMPLPEPPKEEV